MSEYNFEEERGDQDFDYRDEFEPTADMINDWNIHNDHQDDNDNLTDEQLDIIDSYFCPSCGTDISRRAHYRMCDSGF